MKLKFINWKFAPFRKSETVSIRRRKGQNSERKMERKRFRVKWNSRNNNSKCLKVNWVQDKIK